MSDVLASFRLKFRSLIEHRLKGCTDSPLPANLQYA